MQIMVHWLVVRSKTRDFREHEAFACLNWSEVFTHDLVVGERTSSLGQRRGIGLTGFTLLKSGMQVFDVLSNMSFLLMQFSVQVLSNFRPAASQGSFARPGSSITHVFVAPS